MGIAAVAWAMNDRTPIAPHARLCLLHIANNGYPEANPVTTSVDALADACLMPLHMAMGGVAILQTENLIHVLHHDLDDVLTVVLCMPGWESIRDDWNDVERWMKFANKPVVYHLYDADDLVYIGSTGNLRNRLARHRAEGRIKFDEWVADVQIDRQTAYDLERETITRLQPRYNRAGVQR